MVENGCLDNGKEIDPSPDFFIGAAANPFVPPYDYRPYRLAKKVVAGARFNQTHLIYNVDCFCSYMKQVNDLSLAEQVYIFADVGPFESVRAAEYMANKVAGTDVPQALVERMAKMPKAAQPEEGIRICTEIIEQVREIPGVAVLHIMAVNWAESVLEIFFLLVSTPARSQERRKKASS